MGNSKANIKWKIRGLPAKYEEILSQLKQPSGSWTQTEQRGTTAAFGGGLRLQTEL